MNKKSSETKLKKYNLINILHAFYYKAFLVILLLIISHINAQSLSGFVYNEDKETLSGVIITLLDPEKDETLEYTTTDNKGFFTFPNLKKGNYKITINAIGYNKEESLTNFTGTQTNNYILKSQKEQKIEEVIITSIKPIKIKSDTIEIDAKSYKDGTERSVEDLLKKLPGISVDNEGKIKIQGKEVEKVMVDNDDFFDKGYTLLTKNMSVQPIEKVQILQNYSNNKHLKGVENSEKIAINLTLGENTKNNWFGSSNLSSSFFPNDYHSEKLNLAKFGKVAKYFFLGSMNNIGKNNVGDLSHLIRPFSQEEPGIINIEDEAYKFGTDISVYLPFGSEKAKFNNDKLISINSIVKLNKKAKVRFLSLGNFEKLNIYKTSVTNFNLGEKSFSNIEESYRNFTKKMLFNKIDFDYDISKKMTFKYSTNINLWNSVKNDNQNFNGLPWLEYQNTDNRSTDNHLLFTHKINDKMVWLSGLRYLYENVEDHSMSDRFFFQNLISDTVQNFNQTSVSKLRFLGFVSQILYKTNKDNLWNLKIFNNNSTQYFVNAIGGVTDDTSFLLGDDYRNNFKNVNSDFAFSLEQTTSLKNFKINSQVEAHYVNNKSVMNNLSQKDFIYILPSLNILWQIHNKGKLNSSFFISRNNTNILEMLPNYFSSNPRFLSRGVGNFDFLKSSGATLRYTYGNWADRIFVNIFGSYTTYHDYFSNKYNIQQEYSVSDLIYLKNRKDYLFSSELNYFLKKIKSNVKISYVTTTSNYKDIIENNNLRNVKSSYQKIGVQLKSGWKNLLNYGIGTNLNATKIITNTENKILYQDSFLELYFTLNEKLNFQISQNYYSFDGFFNKSNSYHFLDFKIHYQYNNSLTFSLIGNNIFNTKKYKSIIITDFSVNTKEYELFPRYVMLDINFGF